MLLKSSLRILSCVLLVLFVFTVNSHAQDSKPAAVEPKVEAPKPDLKPIEITSEKDRVNYEKLQIRFDANQDKLNLIILQFLNSNEGAKAIQESNAQIQVLAAELKTKICKDLGLDPAKYDIKGDPAVIVPLP